MVPQDATIIKFTTWLVTLQYCIIAFAHMCVFVFLFAHHLGIMSNHKIVYASRLPPRPARSSERSCPGARIPCPGACILSSRTVPRRAWTLLRAPGGFPERAGSLGEPKTLIFFCFSTFFGCLAGGRGCFGVLKAERADPSGGLRGAEEFGISEYSFLRVHDLHALRPEASADFCIKWGD